MFDPSCLRRFFFFTSPAFSRLRSAASTVFLSIQHSYGLQAKKLSPHFACRKIGCSNTLKIDNLQNVQNLEGHPQKENRQRTVRSSACCSMYFRNRNRIVRSRFRLSYFVTVLIQVSARTLPSSAELPIEIRL